MKLKDILDKTTQFFREKKIETPRLDAELLLAHTLGLKRIDLYLKFDQPLAEPELEKCRAVVRRRSSGEPVAYILGEKGFFKDIFFVDKNVLIPRPETETLVETALEEVSKQKAQDQALQILDLGCGSGCIGLSLLKSLPNAKVTLVDISPEALGVTKKNAEALQVFDRCELLAGDAGSYSFEGKQIDVLVANPPYIDPEDSRVQKEVRQFEPHQALFSADQGLAALKAWSSNAANLVKPNGFAIFEFGMGQEKQVLEHFKSLQIFSEFRIVKDLAGIDRHILAKRKDSHG
jgi:release factor glutamine methyltransferase